MRRWIAGVLALLACGAVLTIGTAGLSFRPATGVVRVLSRALLRQWHVVLAPPVVADELKDWQPVAPESVGRSTGRASSSRTTSTRTSRRAAAPVDLEPDSLLPPEPPGVPAVPRGPGHSGEMMRIGSDIHIDADQTVTGDVVAISGDVTVDGHVKGDVMAMRGNVYLNSTARVDGDVVCLGGELHEETGASVGGQRVTALGGRHRRALLREHGEFAVASHWSRFVKTVLWLLINLALVWLIVRIAPGRSGRALERLHRETAASFGIGLLAWVLLVPSLVALCLVVAILCITIIGIPVALAALFAYFILVALIVVWGTVVGAGWLGDQLVNRNATTVNVMRAAVTGMILLIGARAAGHLIGVVPWFHILGGFLVAVSWIATGLVATLGAGALLRAEFASGGPGQWWRGVRAPRGGTPAPSEPSAAPAPASPSAPAAPTGFDAGSTSRPAWESGSSGFASPPASPPAPPPPAAPPPVDPYPPPPSQGG